MRERERRTFVALAVATLLSASCAAPQLGAPPVQSQGVSAQQNIVEYVVLCRGCTVEFTTTGGLGRVEDVRGRFSRRFDFAAQSPVAAVQLRAVPADNEYIVRAEISVNGRVAAEAGRGAQTLSTGEIVQLGASF